MVCVSPRYPLPPNDLPVLRLHQHHTYQRPLHHPAPDTVLLHCCVLVTPFPVLLTYGVGGVAAVVVVVVRRTLHFVTNSPSVYMI